MGWCPKCHHQNEAGGRFCSQCGAVLPHQRCPACGTSNDLEAFRCFECGHVLRVAQDPGAGPRATDDAPPQGPLARLAELSALGGPPPVVPVAARPALVPAGATLPAAGPVMPPGVSSIVPPVVRPVAAPASSPTLAVPFVPATPAAAAEVPGWPALPVVPHPASSSPPDLDLAQAWTPASPPQPSVAASALATPALPPAAATAVAVAMPEPGGLGATSRGAPSPMSTTVTLPWGPPAPPRPGSVDLTSALESVVRAVAAPVAIPPPPVASRVTAVDLYLDSPAPSAPDIELPIGEPALASRAALAGARPASETTFGTGSPGALLGKRKFGPLAVGTGVGLLLAVLLVAVLQLRQALTPATEGAALSRVPRPPVVDVPERRLPAEAVDSPAGTRPSVGAPPMPGPMAGRDAPAGPSTASSPSAQARRSPAPAAATLPPPAPAPATGTGLAARRPTAGNPTGERGAVDAEADAALEAAERLLGAAQGAAPAAAGRRTPAAPAAAASRAR